MTRVRTWRGAFVADRLGITIEEDPARSVIPVRSLVGMALRRNPRRAHLLVSTVLAKHVPTRPWVATAAGELLGLAVASVLSEARSGPRDGEYAGEAAGATAVAVRSIGTLLETALTDGSDAPWSDVSEDRILRERVRSALDAARPVPSPDVVTVGFAETATGLGSLVSGVLGSRTIHSTRLDPPGARALTGFEESHSHATDHRLLPSGALLRPGGTVVLVDDELSTGATIVNAIRALHGLVPQALWVVAALIDLRSAEDRRRLRDLADDIGAPVRVVSLGSGTIDLPGDAAEVARLVVAEIDSKINSEVDSDAPLPDPPTAGTSALLDLTSSVPPIRSDRFGTAGGVDPELARTIADAVAARLGVPNRDRGVEPGTYPVQPPQTGSVPEPLPDPPPVARPRRVLVLGTEEHIALPLAVADALAPRLPDGVVRFSTTTRSPVVAADRPDYAIASAVTFASHDRTLDGPGVRHAYNLVREGVAPDVIVVIPEPGTPAPWLDTPDGLLRALERHAAEVLVVLLPDDLPTGRDHP